MEARQRAGSRLKTPDSRVWGLQADPIVLSVGNVLDRDDPLYHALAMFDAWAFRTWGHILVGACLVSGLFLGLMLMAEEVVGDGARFTRAVITVTAAAFAGYVGTAWIVRVDGSTSETSRR